MVDDRPVPMADDPVSEHERQSTVRKIQRAMVEGHVDFDELDDRFTRVFEAETRSELAAVVADLPSPPAPAAAFAGHPAPATSISLFGDVKVGGWLAVRNDLTAFALFGDIVIDLSTASLPDDVTITAYSVFGDTTVIVPDGVGATIEGVTLFGDRKSALSPARLGAPTVRVVSYKLFGDVKLYSLSLVPEGPFRRLWRTLRGGG